MGFDEHSSETDSSLEIPLFALRPNTRYAISQLLNATKVIPSPDGLQRDWRGLAELAGVICPSNCNSDNTATVLSLWERKTRSASIKQLQEFFCQLDRWDVFDDTAPLIENDIKEYLRRKEGITECERDQWEADAQILTVDDTYRIEQGLQPQHYDAFLLFAEEDNEYAMMILDILENQHGCKLCLKDRDLVGGILFEHEAIMHLIAERCNRLIIIISPAFLDSQFNKFFVIFAQAVGIEQGKRKIVPCMFERFNLPSQLKHYYVLFYNESIPQSRASGDFWIKLSKSVLRKSSPSIHRRIPQLCIEAPKEIGETFPSELVKSKDLNYVCKKVEKLPEEPESPHSKNTAKDKAVGNTKTKLKKWFKSKSSSRKGEEKQKKLVTDS